MRNRTADRNRKRLPSFSGVVEDVVMIDKMQADLFASLGRTRGPFHGVADWPCLDEALAERSRQVLAEEGRERWQEAGGTRGHDGKPTCLLTSRLTAEVVREIAVNPGGLIWTDKAGEAWAVRLLPAASSPTALLGFAIGWRGDHTLVDRPQQKTLPVRSLVTEARHHLELRSGGLRLGARAQQLLMAIHLAVVSQRRSVVLLPDILLGQIIWGGNRKDWPQDWRRDLFNTLRSLTNLRSEVLRLSAEGWRPQLGAYSVAVASVDQVWVTRPHEDVCRSCCPMWGSNVHHCHFAIQAGWGFLGVMEKFVSADEGKGGRIYNFKRWPEGEAGEELTEAKKTGQLINMSVPGAILAPSPWSGQSAAEISIVQALIGEVTRTRKKTSRLDKAEVFTGNSVPGLKAKAKIVCPLLQTKDRHVAFCGNGDRPGAGYLIVGHKNSGWLNKCRYPIPQDDKELLLVIRDFLAALNKVERLLGLTVAALDPQSMQWFDLPKLVALAGSRHRFPKLVSIHLRIYGPDNYLLRYREHLANRGGFACIPGGHGQESGQAEPVTDLDLVTRIRLAGIRQVELARCLKVSQPRVSQMMNSSKAWPAGVRKRVETLVRQRLALAHAGGQVA